MKINRLRKAQKYMNFFCNNYAFRKPFQILIDGTFCYAALKHGVKIQELIPKYLAADVKLLTTQCVILETEKLGSSVHGAMLIVKQFSVHRCGHNSAPVSGSACIESMLGTDNSSRYVVATQDRELQGIARHVPGTPILYLDQRAPTLDKPSKWSCNTAEANSKARLGVNNSQEEALSMLKSSVFGPEQLPKKKKRKGGPNPLSCKKKKKTKPIQLNVESSGSERKRKRKRLKLPKHYKVQ